MFYIVNIIFILVAASLAGNNLSYASINNIAPGDLIRGNFSTVYYYGADGNRYSFPNEKTFFTWYDDFQNVQTIDDTTLGRIPLAGNVTYQPGTRMIKIESDPKTYVVERGGTLRWVTSEAAAKVLYGDKWNTMVDDMSVAFFPYYTLGDDLVEPLEHDRDEITTFSRTINIDKGLRSGSYEAPQIPKLEDPGSSVGTGNPFEISWSEVIDATLYRLEKDTDINFFDPYIEYLGDSTSITDSITRTESTVYYYRVKAINAAGHSEWSQTQAIAISIENVPGRMIMLDPGVSYETGTPFTVAWISADQDVRFEVERDDSTAFDDPTLLYTGSSTSIPQTLTPDEDTIYYFRVRARNTAGYSAWSNLEDILITTVEE